VQTTLRLDARPPPVHAQGPRLAPSKGTMHRSKRNGMLYSITSSAIESTLSEILM